MQINWSSREVDVFLALAETLSFRRTALRMHVSQSAVSGTVARLEEALGVRLFDRTTRTVQLTQAGEVFVEQAQFVSHQMQETVRRVRAVAQLQVGRLALAALPSLAAGPVPRAFSLFAAEFPGVQLELIDSLAGPAFDMVRAGRVDFALTAANPAYADLDWEPLASDRFVLLLAKDHPLAKGRSALAWATHCRSAAYFYARCHQRAPVRRRGFFNPPDSLFPLLRGRTLGNDCGHGGGQPGCERITRACRPGCAA